MYDICWYWLGHVCCCQRKYVRWTTPQPQQNCFVQKPMFCDEEIDAFILFQNPAPGFALFFEEDVPSLASTPGGRCFPLCSEYSICWFWMVFQIMYIYILYAGSARTWWHIFSQPPVLHRHQSQPSISAKLAVGLHHLRPLSSWS